MRRAGFLNQLSCRIRHAHAGRLAPGQLGEQVPQRASVKITRRSSFPTFVAGWCEFGFEQLNYEDGELRAHVPPKCSECLNPVRIKSMGGVDRRWTIASCTVPDNRWLPQRSERSSVSDGGFNGTNILRPIRISLVSTRWLENNASRDGKFTRGQR